MRLAFSTNAFTGYTLSEAIEWIARVGYEGVEILADWPHAFIDEKWHDTELIRSLLFSTRLLVSNINANTAIGFFKPGNVGNPFEPSLSNTDSFLRRWRIDYTRRCIDLAVCLGSRSISVTSGPDIPEKTEKSMSLFIDSLYEIIEYGKEHSVYIGIEYEPGLLTRDAEKTFEVLDIIRSPYLGVNLDIGHACVAGEDFREIIPRFGPNILNIHIEDIKGRKHFHLIPGMGDIDFDFLLKILKDIDYGNFLTVELYTYASSPVEAATKALDFLRERVQV